MTGERIAIRLLVNGENVAADVAPRQHLADFLRETLGLTGTHIGCEHGVCGACGVRLDGLVVRSCLTLAVQADGARVETIEGVSDSGEIADLQSAFEARNALQCGYCTPGQILSGIALLAEKPQSLATIREGMSGNLCRCGAHPNIVAAIAEVAGL